ncbi:MAG: AAA family ATPase [Planctomycetota bacterium]
MVRLVQTLLLSADPGLAAELSSAAEELTDDLRLALHVETDERQGVERAAHRRTDLVIIEMDEDVERCARIVAEIQRSDPAPVVAVAHRPGAFGDDAALSAAFVRLLRAGARDFLRRPLPASELEALVRRQFGDEGAASSRRGRIVSFVGSKGGVGKSTLAVNVAVDLARRGTVLLVDASLQHGVLAELLDLEPEFTIRDAARQIDRLDARLLTTLSMPHASGVRLLAAPKGAVEAAEIDDGILARVLAEARRAFDFVVVDTFPLVESVTVAVLDLSDLAFVTLNDFVPTVGGTAELLGVLRRLGVDDARVRVVLNRTHPGRRARVAAADVAARLDHDVDFVVPYSRGVLAATGLGRPPAQSVGRHFGWGRAVDRIAREAAEWKDEGLADPSVSLDGTTPQPPVPPPNGATTAPILDVREELEA